MIGLHNFSLSIIFGRGGILSGPILVGRSNYRFLPYDMVVVTKLDGKYHLVMGVWLVSVKCI